MKGNKKHFERDLINPIVTTPSTAGICFYFNDREYIEARNNNGVISISSAKDNKYFLNFLKLIFLLGSCFFLMSTLNVAAYCFIISTILLTIMLFSMICPSRLRSRYTAGLLVANFLETKRKLPTIQKLKLEINLKSLKSLGTEKLKNDFSFYIINILTFFSTGIMTAIAKYCNCSFLVITITFFATITLVNFIATKFIGKLHFTKILMAINRHNLTQRVDELDLYLASLAGFYFLKKTYPNVYNPISYERFIARYSLKVNSDLFS